jgi:hypothetical protein
MHILMVLLSLALLMRSEPASAQTTYSVSVSHHSDLPALSETQVSEILANASKLLQKPGQADTAEDVQCNVAFTLKGPIRTFSSADKVVNGDLDIAELHRIDSQLDVDFRIKVVQEIGFCRKTSGTFNGCAYPIESRSIVIVHPQLQKDQNGQLVADYPNHVLWAHEFGHLTGLGHRRDDKALMTCGGITRSSVRVQPNECRCLLGGLGSCKLPPPLFC